MSTSTSRFRLAPVLLALTLAVCVDEEPTPIFTPEIDIGLAAAALTITQGQLDSVPVSIACHHYTGSVTLSVTGAPSGLTVTINPKLIPAGITQSKLHIAAAASVTPGIYSLTVTGTAPGVGAKSAILRVTVDALPPPAIAVQLDVTSLTVPQGQSNNTTLRVTRTNYAGLITLAVTGAPEGVNVTVDPPTLNGGAWSSVLKVSATADKAPGTHTLTVTAAGVGVAAKEAQLVVRVIEHVPPSLSVYIDFDGFITIWTYRDGTWPWSVGVKRLGGYTGPVTFSVEGLPPLVSAEFSNIAEIGNGEIIATVVFSADAKAPLGCGHATIRAAGSGVPDATVTFPFCVAPAG